MKDNELLLAISDMLDTKLEEKLEEKLKPIKEDVQHVKLYQENMLEPRLNTIEACYTSTYDRYKNDVDRMEKAFDDIDMLKRTVSRHSEQLRKMA